MQIRTLVCSRYNHIKYLYQVYTDSEHIPKQTELSVYIRIIFRLIQFLMLITGLCLFGTPVGVTELILGFLILYGAYSRILDRKIPIGITEYFLVQSTCRYYRTYSLYRGTRRYYWTYTYFIDTGVPVGTTEIYHIQEYP